MYEDLLRDCGLTQNESLVYLALLKIGKSKSGEIVKEANISGGKIYETLYKLVDKGLVKFVSENNIKYFMANEPSTLLDYLREKERVLCKKEKELSKILPELKLLKKKDENLEIVFLVKGLRGVSSLVYESLKKAKIIKIMGVRSSKETRYNNFWRNWHRERVKLKKKAQILFSDKNTDYRDFFNKLKYTEIKEFKHFTPSAIMIIDNQTFIFTYEEDIVCIHSISESIAKSFLGFFNGLWEI